MVIAQFFLLFINVNNILVFLNVKERFGKIRKITPDIIMEKKKITFFLEIEKKVL